MGSAPSIAADHRRDGLSSPPVRRRGNARVERLRRRSPKFQALPREILSHVKVFLTGPDLFTLSHVDHRLYHLLSNAELWAKRMANFDLNPWLYKQYLADTAKMRYAQARSWKFPGVSMDAKRVGIHDRGGSIALPRIVRSFHHDPISFDLWFSLLPPSTSTSGGGSGGDGRRVFTGGVLFGSQSNASDARGGAWTNQNEHIVHVDTDCNLYCSLMWQKPVVASKLQFHRWYHVALSFDGEVERVYVDGSLANTDSSSQLTAWSDLPFAQLGTGMLSARSPGKPFPDFYGWYGFFGVIDDFRIWNLALSAEQIAKLARGQYIKSSPSYRLKRGAATTTTCGRVQTVRCTRPMERVLEIVPWNSRRKKLHQWLSKVKKNSTQSASCISIQAR